MPSKLILPMSALLRLADATRSFFRADGNQTTDVASLRILLQHCYRKQADNRIPALSLHRRLRPIISCNRRADASVKDKGNRKNKQIICRKIIKIDNLALSLPNERSNTHHRICRYRN